MLALRELVNATTTIASAAAKQSRVDLIVMMTSPFAPAKQTLGYGATTPGVNPKFRHKERPCVTSLV